MDCRPGEELYPFILRRGELTCASHVSARQCSVETFVRVLFPK